MRQLSAATTRSVPVSAYHYVPAKRRWWPLFAGLGAAGISALVLLGPSPQQFEPSQQKPLVHQFARSDGLSPMTGRAKARAGRAHETAGPSVGDGPAVDLFAMRLADAQAAASASSPPAETAQATQVRTSTAAVQVKAKRPRSSRYAARKSHRRDAFAYWGYGGGYSWGRYGYGGGRGYFN